MTDNSKVAEMLQLSIFLYDIDFVDGELIGELARRGVQKFEKSIKLSRYSNQNFYVSDINSFFISFRCNTCDTMFSKTGNLERHFITCSEWVKQTHLKNVYQLRGALFEKLDSFNIPYRWDQKLLKNGHFNFESFLREGRDKQRNWKYKMDWKTCSYISFTFAKPKIRTHFSLQVRSSTACILFHQCI